MATSRFARWSSLAAIVGEAHRSDPVGGVQIEIRDASNLNVAETSASGDYAFLGGLNFDLPPGTYTVSPDRRTTSVGRNGTSPEVQSTGSLQLPVG